MNSVSKTEIPSGQGNLPPEAELEAKFGNLDEQLSSALADDEVARQKALYEHTTSTFAEQLTRKEPNRLIVHAEGGAVVWLPNGERITSGIDEHPYLLFGELELREGEALVSLCTRVGDSLKRSYLIGPRVLARELELDFRPDNQMHLDFHEHFPRFRRAGKFPVAI